MARTFPRAVFAAMFVATHIPAQAPPTTIELNTPVERPLAPNGKESFVVKAETGQFVQVRVEKKGIDVAVSILGSSGEKVVTSLIPNGRFGLVEASFLAGKAGEYHLDVESAKDENHKGTFRVELLARRGPNKDDSTRLRAEDALRTAIDLDSESDEDQMRKAIDAYAKAADLFAQLKDQYWQGLAIHRLARGYQSIGDYPRAVELYNRALGLRTAAGDHVGEAQTLHNLANLYHATGEQQKALDMWNQALPLFRAVGYQEYEADTLHGIGRAYHALDDKQKALESYNEALTLYRSLSDRDGQADVLRHAGNLYYDADQNEKALTCYGEALSLYRDVGDRAGEAYDLDNIGLAYYEVGESQKALDFLKQALAILRVIGDRHGEAGTLLTIGRTYRALGDKRNAEDFLSQAWAIYLKLKDLKSASYAFRLDCPLLQELTEKSLAAGCYSEELAVSQAIEDKEAEAETRVHLAQVSADPKAAVMQYATALELYKQLRLRDRETEALYSLAKLYGDLGEYQKSYDVVRQSLGKVHALLVSAEDHGKSGDVTGIQAALEKLGADVHTIGPDEASVPRIHAELTKIGDASAPNDSLLLFYMGSGDSTKTEYRLKAKHVDVPPPDTTSKEPQVLSVPEAITAGLFRSWIDRLAVQNVFICLDVPPAPGLDALENTISGVGDALSSLQERQVLVIGPPAYSATTNEMDDPRNVLGKALIMSLSPESDRNQDGFISFPEIEEAFYANMLSEQLDSGVRGTSIARPQVYGSGGNGYIFATGMAPRGMASRGTALPAARVSDELKTDFTGKYYALIIATDDYDEWNHLNNPLFDAREVEKELHDRYGFETELVANPTRDEFVNRFAALKKRQFGPDDELLIFIAGHGTYDETEQTGYLIAKDSKRVDDAHNTHISQQQIFSIVSGLKARHVFVVIDACFGGAIAGLKRDDPKSDITYTQDAKLQTLTRKRNDRTRIYLTSGGKEYVPDGKPGSHSPFAFQFLRALKSKNPGGGDAVLTFLDFMTFADQVQNAPQPKYGWFPDADPASDFWLFADPDLRNPARAERLPVITQK